MTSFPESALPPADTAAAWAKAVAMVGFGNTGKTGLICRLLPWLISRGLRVAVLKHSHKSPPDLGDEGKDTGRYRQAGARAVGLAAPGLFQVTRSYPGEPPLEEALAALAGEVDLVLVEGYKSGPLPKVAVLGPGDEVPTYPHLIAVVSGAPVNTPLPVFQPHQIEELGLWLYDRVKGR